MATHNHHTLGWYVRKKLLQRCASIFSDGTPNGRVAEVGSLLASAKMATKFLLFTNFLTNAPFLRANVNLHI